MNHYQTRLYSPLSEYGGVIKEEPHLSKELQEIVKYLGELERLLEKSTEATKKNKQ